MPPPSIDNKPPWVVLLAVLLLTSAESIAFAVNGVRPPTETEGLWTAILNSSWSWWVFVDRRRRNRFYPFEFDALVFFAWPIVVPYYLHQSRTERSIRGSLVVWLAYATPFVLAATLYVAYA